MVGSKSQHFDHTWLGFGLNCYKNGFLILWSFDPISNHVVFIFHPFRLWNLWFCILFFLFFSFLFSFLFVFLLSHESRPNKIRYRQEWYYEGEIVGKTTIWLPTTTLKTGLRGMMSNVIKNLNVSSSSPTGFEVE